MSGSEITPRDPAAHDDVTPRLGRPSAAPLAALADGALAIGAHLADGRYEILGVLGSGGMGTVYAARDRDLERPVALKVLREDRAAVSLLAEARMLAAAHTPAVVSVYAVHLDAHPPFLVLEHVDGVSLDRWLAEGQRSWSDKWRVLRAVAGALDHLHARGIAHGDVKTANVLVTRDGHAKLADFGVTRLLARARPGEVVGTPAYMPPERARATSVDEALHGRGDVYSFAVLVYVVLSGRPPFVEIEPSALLRAHVSETPPRLSEVSDRSTTLDAPLFRALAKDPLARPARAGELMAELDAASRGLDAEGRALRVLVVDDDAAIRLLHTAVLRASLPAATLDTAADGYDALRQVRVHAPAVLVVDLAMPGLSGLALAEQVLRASPTTNIVVVTGQGSGLERTAAVALGVRHFLVKPVETDELTRCVLDCMQDRVESA